jgi:hypothetical protein
MPYEVKTNGAGPWVQGDVIEDADFEQYAFKDKFLRNGSVVKVNEHAARARDLTDQQAQVGDLDAQIAQLQAERAKLLGVTPEPNAPAQVAYVIQPDAQPTAQEIAAVRAAGNEVVQPTPGNVNVGEVVPGEAAEKPKAGRK